MISTPVRSSWPSTSSITSSANIIFICQTSNPKRYYLPGVLSLLSFRLLILVLQIRVNLNVPIKAEVKAESVDVLKTVDEDRKYVIQATIVRYVQFAEMVQFTG